MSFLGVTLFTLVSYYVLLQLGFCKAYQNCLVALIKITTVIYENLWKRVEFMVSVLIDTWTLRLLDSKRINQHTSIKAQLG